MIKAPDQWFREQLENGQGIFDRPSFLNCMISVTRWRIALDCGAHVGSWTLALSQRFGKVHAFEPEPTNWKFLQENVGHVENIVTHNVALGHETSYMGMAHGNNSGAAYLTEGGNIKVRPLDECIPFEDTRKVDFIKFDLEGYELIALHGAEQIIERSRPIIMLEFGHEDRYGITADQINAHMTARGYRCASSYNKDFVYVPV